MTVTPTQRVARARQRVKKAERDLRQEIVAAFIHRAEGHTVRDIASAADLTVQRVYQIVQEEALPGNSSTLVEMTTDPEVDPTSVPCPKCGVRAGAPCMSPRGYVIRTHVARVLAAEGGS